MRIQAFPIQSIESVAYSRHQTVGIDVFITPERTILLDTEVSRLDQSIIVLIFTLSLAYFKLFRFG